MDGTVGDPRVSVEVLKWITVDVPPAQSGYYLLAHRGNVVGLDYYIHPDDNEAWSNKLGWQKGANFMPTHYALYQGPQAKVNRTEMYDKMEAEGTLYNMDDFGGPYNKKVK